MAASSDDETRKSRRAGAAPQAQQETLQVRVRNPNPLIERRHSSANENETVLEAPLDPSSLTVTKTMVRDEESASGFDTVPSMSERARVEVTSQPRPQNRAAAKHAAERPSPRSNPDEAVDAADTKPLPRLPLGDDDDTVVASGPPQTAAALAEAGARRKPVDEEPIALILPADPAAQEDPTVVPGALPRGRWGEMGTKGAGAAVQRARIHRTDQNLPEVRSSALKMVRAELPASELAILDRTLAGDFESVDIDASRSPKRTLERLINDRGYNDLIPKERAQLLSVVAKDPRDVATVKSVLALSKTGVLGRLREDHRQALYRLLAALGADARTTVARMAARRIGKSSVLEDRDSRDEGLIVHLEKVALHDTIADDLQRRGVERRRVLGVMLGSLATPEKLPFEEGAEGVLGAFEFALAEGWPAEFARIWRGVVTELMVPLAGDATINLAPALVAQSAQSFSNQNTPFRVAMESLVQQARPRTQRSRSGFIMPGGYGIDADVTARALEMIYGMGFTVAAGTANALRHLEDTAPRRRVPPVFVSVLYERGERLFLFERIEPDRVLLRAPHGRSTKPTGAVRSDPDRTVVDPDRSIDALDRRSFEENVGVALVPRT